MTPLKIVFVDVGCYRCPGLLDIVPLSQVSLIVLEGAKPPLDHDVISPAALAIHALADAIVSDEILVFMTCKL